MGNQMTIRKTVYALLAILLNGFVAQQAVAGVNYIHTDHLGTPQIVTDEAGGVVWEAHYSPFGEVTITMNTTGLNIRFPGQYFDAETGLHYNYYRDYDPTTGRYLQSDPIGLQGGLNTYAYVGSNPLRDIDPSGLTQCDLDVAKDIADGTQSGSPLKGPHGYGRDFTLEGSNPRFAPGREIGEWGPGRYASGSTRPISGIRINEERFGGCLSDDEAADLLDTVIHEGTHWSLPWIVRGAPNPDQFDAGGTSGYVYKETARRLVPGVVALYLKERARRCACECK